MAVAKTYTHMELQGEPFKENGKMYVNVLAPKGIKKVRWYSDAEYRRMYPESEVTANDIMDFNARHAFGFGDLGYITIYKGNESALEDFADGHHEYFRRNLTFGYYTPSAITVYNLPSGVCPIRLLWDSVMAHDDRMKPHDEVIKIIAALIGNNTNSQFQGEINEWLQKTVTVKEKKSNETHFGTKHAYTLEDAENNLYIWETGAKDYTCGQAVSLKMKVKEHKEVRNEKITVVWYCKEV
jgi:hypothetical protein